MEWVEILAQSLIEKEEFVIGTFRNQTEADDFNKNYQDRGFALQLDLSQPDNIEQKVTALIQKFGHIDVLVNNAGVGFIGAIEEASLTEVRQVMEVNFFGTLKLTQSILPHMRTSKAGHIIQISSHAGVKAFAGFGIYNASKFALEGFSEALAQEVAPLGIRVHLVEPGPFRTGFAGARLNEAEKEIEDYKESAGAFRQILRNIDGKQEGDPEKAALAIIALVNNQATQLRMPLGATAVKRMSMKVESLQADITHFKSIAENAIFES